VTSLLDAAQAASKGEVVVLSDPGSVTASEGELVVS